MLSPIIETANFEHVVHLRENNGYNGSLSHISESMTNQLHVMVLDELDVGALEYEPNKSDIDDKGIMIGTVKIIQVEDSKNLV